MDVEAVKELAKTQSGSQIILILILVLIVTVLLLENWNKLKKLVGLRSVKEIHEENQEKEIQKIEEEVGSIKDDVAELQTYSKEATKKRKEFEMYITNTLAEMKEDMIDDRINRIRWEILDFSNSCSKRNYNKEAFDHVLELYYSTYNMLLSKYGRSNGKVDLAIDHIEKQYAEYMEKGFPEY